MSLMVHQQQNHISKLLNTAAAGTGVVEDVDALLMTKQMIPVAKGDSISKPERNLWREDEMLQMLKFMYSTNALELLNDKTVKSEKVFRNVEKLMNNCGYRKKSYMQIWTKWKFLKSTYMTSTRAGVIPKVVPYRIYQMLHKILSNSGANGGGNSSIEGDNSNAGQLVISSVESGILTNGKDSPHNLNESSALDNDKDAEEEGGLAHPIFGFRLGGLVKQEPEDIEFEMSHNTIITDDPLDDSIANSTCSSAVNTYFQTEIKEEMDDSDSSSKPLQSIQSNLSADILPETTKLPPLRIAPFAKVPMHDVDSHQEQNRQLIDRSPPPLSMHSVQQRQQLTHRHYTRQSQAQANPNNKNRNPNNLRMLLPKPAQIQQHHKQASQSATATPIRIPKDITIHHSRSTGSAPVMPRLKPISVSSMQAFHPQRIETVLPDSDSNIIIQQQKQQFAINYLHNGGASTSQQAVLGQISTPTLNNQKRRLQLPYSDPPRPTKLAKTYANIKQTQVIKEPDVYQDYYDDVEDDDESESQDDNLSMLEPMTESFQHARQQQQQQQFKQFQQQQKAKKAKKLKKEEESFEASLRGLGKSLRSIQCKLIDEFFEKQMELAKEEHEFQSKQDALLMAAFEEQAQLIMKSAKKLLGIDLPNIVSTEGEINQTEGKFEPKQSPNKRTEDDRKKRDRAQLEKQDEDDENEEQYNKQHEENPDMSDLEEEESNEEDNDLEENDEQDYEDEDQESENLLGDPIDMVSSELFEEN